MAFTDMNDVEQELGEEKPPKRNGNRTFIIIAGTLGGIIILALLCIAGLALFRYLPNQRAAQNAEATKAAQDTAVALSASQTATGEWVDADDVDSLETGDTIWIPETPPGPKFWDVFTTSLTILGQVASIIAATIAVIIATRK